MPTLPNDADSENWGYKFVGSAVDKFIRDVDGQAVLEAYPDFSDRRNRAEDLMFDLVGEEPCLFYVRRKGAGREPKEEIWELTIATDRDDFQLPARLEKLGKTLGFRAAVPKMDTAVYGCSVVDCYHLHKDTPMLILHLVACVCCPIIAIGSTFRQQH